jgi:hypothetical protein
VVQLLLIREPKTLLFDALTRQVGPRLLSSSLSRLCDVQISAILCAKLGTNLDISLLLLDRIMLQLIVPI